ncbi:MAG TPA: NAD-dependent epimerase/dehydratase family protein [Ktedonobacteraceae bacterium]|nr:NAD-dependent epimerase/dehydratase family protein [Ktedonobacteraceae bacterium]
MRLLILGGTGFLGRHLVQAALDRQHTVTLFNRGFTHPELFPHVEQLHGDREHGLQALQGRSWETVIDSNGQLPRHVRASISMLADCIEHCTFISTTSVYADYTVAPIDEGSPLAHLEDSESSALTPETYGARKALCEHYAEQALQGRVLVIRPGLIVGPHDPTDRFTYWPYRIAQGGQVLAPGDPEQPVQFIDVRDLAQWTIAMSEARQAGVYNAKGPADPLPIRQFLQQCRDGSDTDATFTWVSEPFLLEHGVVPYIQLPLWVPSTLVGFPRVDCRKAIAAGLTFRPLRETIHDTLVWDATRPTDGLLRAGLTAQHERQLLCEWHHVAGG